MAGAAQIGKAGWRRWARTVIHSVKHGAPALLFLASLMTLLAKNHIGQTLEPAMMRSVYSLERTGPAWLGLRHGQSAVADAAPARLINLLELSPTAYELDFGRRSPTPRGCIAEAMDRLAERLKDRQYPGGFPVVAIDIDITLDGSEMGQPSSGQPGSCIDNPTRLEQAIGNLRQYATVIGLALERHDDASRRGRNAFIAKVCAADFKPGAPREGSGPRDGGVYFASAATFSRGTEAVYEAPTTLSKDTDTQIADDDSRRITRVAGVDLPPIYPSLGNLLSLARDAHARGGVTVQAVNTLTSVCRAIQPVPSQPDANRRPGNPDALLIDDLLFSANNQATTTAVLHRYDLTLLNFLRGDAHVRVHSLDRLADLGSVSLSSSSILLALTDGSTADRFVTPHDETEFSSGAWLQAVKAVSTREGLTKTAYVGKWLADLLAGVLFCVLVAPMHHLIDHPWRRHPFAHRALTLALPAACAGAVILLGLLASAWLLPLGVWFNPLYMAMGMALHSYVDAGARPSPHHARHAAAPAPAAARGLRVPFATTATTMSDWVDIDGAAPRRERSMPDRVMLGLWTVVYFGVVGWTVYVILKDLLQAFLRPVTGG